MHEYEYQIIYKPGQLHGNMDVLSPLLVSTVQNKEEKPERVVMLAHMDDAPNYILSGWPEIQ